MSADGRLRHDTAYFTETYARDPDPWRFDSSWYEQRKYDLTVAALPRRTYRRGFEPGCANGALTERLADRCAELVACDIVPEVVERARARLSDRPHVEVRSADFPSEWPAGTGDLVVLSEIAYYLTDAGLTVAATELERWLEPGGDVVAVHYTGTTDYPQRGHDVARWLGGLPSLDRVVTLADPGFELGVWRRR